MKIKNIEKELIRLENMMLYEKKYSDYEYIAGVDEVGRGPLAGPVVTASVILPKNLKIYGLNDSKKVSEKNRDEIFDIIVKESISYSIDFVYENIIDEINILEATKISMKNSINNLSIKPDIILTDAVEIPDINIKQINIIKGDEKSVSIAAASILAKVTRDRYMVKLSEKFPMYKWEKNKGYGTKEHTMAIQNYGLSVHHRKSFCKKYL